MRNVRAVVLAVVSLLFMFPVVGATAAEEGGGSSCEVTPTSGWEPRQPYLGKEGAAFVAQNPLYGYGQNPYVYELYVPEDLPDEPVPLLLALHGLGVGAASFENRGFQELANREKLIVALPSGARSWWATEDSFDVKFLRDIVAEIRAERCIDARRIFGLGASNGGFMAARLACDAGDLFAAVYIHAGTPADETYPFGGPCRANEDGAPGFETVPIRFSHGTDDETVAYSVGRRNLSLWVDRYRCDTNPVAVAPGKWGQLERYGNCNRSDIKERERNTGVPFELEFQTFDGHGHILYPDGCEQECGTPGVDFPTADEINDAVYEFLSRNARATPAVAQAAPDIADMPLRDPERHAGWLTTFPDHGPDTTVGLVADDGTPVATSDALASRNLIVEFAVFPDDQYADETLDDHPMCPSTTPGSRKVRVTGRSVTLRITDVDGTTEYTADTGEQPGTGLAVAVFSIDEPAAGDVVVEATVADDRVASHVVCTALGARFQETVPVADNCAEDVRDDDKDKDKDKDKDNDNDEESGCG